MKTILVPIDYSEISNNALEYAVELAKFSKANLVLLHVYHIPLPVNNAPLIVVSPQELEEENKKGIKKVEKKLLKQVGTKIKVESIVREGFVSEEIMNVAKEKNIDLIVMGITGAGRLVQAVIGSNATYALKKSTCPVLIIPGNAKFNRTEKIVYACDYEKIKNGSVLQPVWELAKLFDAEILVFNARDSRMQPDMYEKIEGINLEHWMGKVKHSYWFADNSDIVEAINNFAKKNKAVMVAMVARKHDFPENLIHKSITKHMAYKTEMPYV